MIPTAVQVGLDRYVQAKIRPGGFLYAVLTNDLFGALHRADNESRYHLDEIVRHIWHQLPGECWGSVAKVEAWLDTKEGG